MSDNVFSEYWDTPTVMTGLYNETMITMPITKPFNEMDVHLIIAKRLGASPDDDAISFFIHPESITMHVDESDFMVIRQRKKAKEAKS